MREATRAARPAPHQHPEMSSLMSSAPSSSSSITFCVFCASSALLAAEDIAHAAASRRAAHASPQPAATPAPHTMRVTHEPATVTHARHTNFRVPRSRPATFPYPCRPYRTRKTAFRRRGTGPAPELRPRPPSH
eukprot:7380685-Prymnesium_polylepis.1